MIEKDITPTENLVQDISNELVFGHTHNGVKCAACPTAKRACDRAWFSAKQIEEWSGMSTTTLWRRLNELEECERISRSSDLTNVTIPTETGAVKTTLYNLNVLNQLAMVEMKNKVLNDTAKKFSDIMSEVGTNGSYSIRKPQQQPMMRLPQDFESALEALLTEVRKNKALQEDLDETKALLAEERKYYEILSDAVDEFVRDNARVNDKKGASDLGTASAESKECEEAWMTAREWCLEHQLPVYVKELKWIVSDRLTDICITFPEREQWRLDSIGTRWFPKWACNILDRMYDNDDTFLSEYRTV